MTGRTIHCMHPDTYLDIRLSAILAREKFTEDPAAVIAELRRMAGGRDDILHATVGSWIGYYETESYRRLTDALRVEFGDALQPGIDVGRSRRGMGHHAP